MTSTTANLFLDMKQDRSLQYQLQRIIGGVLIKNSAGPAGLQPNAHKMLKRVGVFEKPFDAWEDAPILDELPMGGSLKQPYANSEEGFEGMWPQQPIIHEQFPAPVFNLDIEELFDHHKHIVSRYIGQIATLTPLLAWQAKRETRVKPMSDALFVKFLTETSLGQFVNLTLDPADRQAFAAQIGSDDERQYAKVDFSCLDQAETLPGIHVAPTVTLLRRKSATQYEVVAIRIRRQIFLPEDTAVWQLSKLFVLQGAAVNIVLTFHPWLHFPGDTINALTKSLLPQGHLLHCLLRPHLEFTLGLHEATIHNRRSVFHNSQKELFTPFPFPTEQIHCLMLFGRTGIPGNSSYPGYRFGNHLLGKHTLYGRYRQEWYETIYDFVKEITRLIPKNDPYVVRWANAISEWLPDFPIGAHIFKDDILTQAIASYICTVSVFHTGDHFSYSMIPFHYAPLRLRIPAPDQELPLDSDMASWVHAEDYFRHKLCHAMFFRPVVLRSLQDAHYQFRTPQSRQAKKAFYKAIGQLDEAWHGSTFPSSHEIAVSLQY